MRKLFDNLETVSGCFVIINAFLEFVLLNFIIGAILYLLVVPIWLWVVFGFHALFQILVANSQFFMGISKGLKDLEK